MNFTLQQKIELKRRVQSIPTCQLAKEFGMSELALLKELRYQRISEELQPIEMQFIVENRERMPASAIQDTLGMTKTQFNQIFAKLASSTESMGGFRFG